MNDKKQIDEIAKLMCTYPQCIHHNIIGECANTECQTVDFAENLYKQGYRKVPEDSVVLLKEEYNALLSEQKRLKEIINRIPCGYELKEKTRKATAREFVNTIYWKAVKHIKGKDKSECFIEISFDKLDEIAKQFGVEI